MLQENKCIKNRNAVNQVSQSPFVKELDSIISKNPNADLILIRTHNIQWIYDKYSEYDVAVEKINLRQANQNTKIPSFYKETFDNGLNNLSKQMKFQVYMRLKIKGKLLEDKKKVGVASITAQMMNESTSLKSSEEISVEMQKLVQLFNFSEDNETLVYFECLSDKLDESLKLLKKIT